MMHKLGLTVAARWLESTQTGWVATLTEKHALT